MPTALIIGAGVRVGLDTATALAKVGYTVAVASRTDKLGSKFKHFPFDASKPESVPNLFSAVKNTLGAPSVIIYNAYESTLTPRNDPLSTPLTTLSTSLDVNAVTPYATAREAVAAFASLQASSTLGPSGGTFIFTGNLLGLGIVAPGFLPFGMGKSAAAHLVQNLALVAFDGEPYKFYYADQRNADGSPKPTGLSGPAHADLYVDLVQAPEQRPWLQTFVEGEGYKAFAKEEIWWPQ